MAESSQVSQIVAQQIAEINNNGQKVDKNANSLNSRAKSLDKLVSSYKFE